MIFMNSILRIPNSFKRGRPFSLPYIWLIGPIFLVLGLVLSATWLNQKHVNYLQSSEVFFYEDKIITQHVLFELANSFNVKRLGLGFGNYNSESLRENTKIEKLLTNYDQTKLMVKESLHFRDLKRNYTEFLVLERSFIEGNDAMLENLLVRMNEMLDQIMENIDHLEKAITTDRSQPSEAITKSKDMNRLLLNTEIAFLIVMGIILQVILFYPKCK